MTEYFNVYALVKGDDWIAGQFSTIPRQPKIETKQFTDIRFTTNVLPPKLKRLTLRRRR